MATKMKPKTMDEILAEADLAALQAVAVQEANARFILTNEQVQKLNALFAGAVVKSGDDLIDKLTRSQQVRLNDGIDILLTTDELWQLKQQAQGMRREYQEYAKEQLEDALSLYLNGCVRIR